MRPNLIYKNYDNSYESRAIDLLNICFPGKSVNNKSFNWKHFDQFFDNGVIAMVALDGERVCAFVCFTPISIENIDKDTSFYSCSVQATHPKYRRMGIITQLTQLIEQKIPSASYLGFSNPSGVQIDIHSKKISYSILGQMVTRYILSLPQKSKLSIKKVETINQDFIDKYTSKFFEIAKTRNYLDWRYAKNPKNNYIYLEVYRESEIIAIIILKKIFVKYELSLILIQNTMDVGVVFKVLVNYSFMHGIILISLSFLNNNFWRTVRQRLSIERKTNIFFTVKSKRSEYLKSDNWLIQGGDIQ